MHKAVMYTNFKVGCQHGDEAIRYHTDSAQKNRDGLEVLKADFVIDVDRPYIGASIQHAPKGKWCCPSCKNLPKFNKQKQRKWFYSYRTTDGHIFTQA